MKDTFHINKSITIVSKREKIMHGIKLDGLNYTQLFKLHADVVEALRVTEKKTREDALKRARQVAIDAGFDLEDLISPTGAGRSLRTPTPPCFADPEDETRTWNGRGRPPKWFTEAIAAGATKDSLRIKS